MLLEELWGAIEESVKSQQWEVYSYIPDLEMGFNDVFFFLPCNMSA